MYHNSDIEEDYNYNDEMIALIWLTTESEEEALREINELRKTG